MITISLRRTVLPVVLGLAVLAAGCSRTAAQPTLESALPVVPGQDWAAAHDALARLDPNLRDAAGLGGRIATAKADLLVAGYRFEELAIAGLADRTAVRSVTLSARAPGAGCDKARDDLLRALGSDWDAGETRLGATTASKVGRSARILCTGTALSLAISG
jgi:hypothetical protein